MHANGAIQLPGIDKFFEPVQKHEPAEPKPEASEAENLEGLHLLRLSDLVLVHLVPRGFEVKSTF